MFWWRGKQRWRRRRAIKGRDAIAIPAKTGWAIYCREFPGAPWAMVEHFPGSLMAQLCVENLDESRQLRITYLIENCNTPWTKADTGDLLLLDAYDLNRK